MRYSEVCSVKKRVRINRPVIHCPYCGKRLARVTVMEGQVFLEFLNHEERVVDRVGFALLDEKNAQRVADKSTAADLLDLTDAGNLQFFVPLRAREGAESEVPVKVLDLLQAALDRREIVKPVAVRS